jgi:CheY-like chemotaxis protein
MDNKYRILYIEDNFQNRRLVRRLLKPKGYDVIEAEDGLQGIAIAAREKPALILMDINLPGIDGMEATSRLKSSPDLASIPVIAVTAAAMRGDRERIMASGCDDYLQKPIDNDELVKLVQRFIGTPDQEVVRAARMSKAVHAIASPSTENAKTQEPAQKSGEVASESAPALPYKPPFTVPHDPPALTSTQKPAGPTAPADHETRPLQPTSSHASTDPTLRNMSIAVELARFQETQESRGLAQNNSPLAGTRTSLGDAYGSAQSNEAMAIDTAR